MRHRKAGPKFNMSGSHRQAMFRNMVTSLLKHDRIKTTDTRAKELRRWADHIITLAKRGDLHARRQALSIVREKNVVHKLFEEADKRFGKINGGYTRIIKLGRRPGDATLVSMIELVSGEVKPKKKTAKPAAKKETPVKPAAETAPAEAEKEPVEAVEGETPQVDTSIKADDTQVTQEAKADTAEEVEAQTETTETKEAKASSVEDDDTEVQASAEESSEEAAEKKED